ncbi:MAG: hypothetical protein AAGA32_17555, partial [Pseudomonadota bacterium]
GVEVAALRVLARALREGGFFSTGARGVNAPDLAPEDAAAVAICLLMDCGPKVASERMAQVAGRRASAHSDTLGEDPRAALGISDRSTLLEYVAAAFRIFEDEPRLDPWVCGGEQRILPRMEIEFREELDTFIFRFSDSQVFFDPDDWLDYTVGIRVSRTLSVVEIARIGRPLMAEAAT